MSLGRSVPETLGPWSCETRSGRRSRTHLQEGFWHYDYRSEGYKSRQPRATSDPEKSKTETKAPESKPAAKPAS